MKKYLIIFLVLLMFPIISMAQATDPMVTKCAMSAGSNTTYLKDFRVQLGKGNPQGELRFKQVFPLSKNMKYKFTLCSADNSTGVLIMKIKDEAGKQVLASFDEKSGKTFPSVEFTCNKTGTYQILFDFMNSSQGLGVGVISLVK
jgi:hypothetical protein